VGEMHCSATREDSRGKGSHLKKKGAGRESVRRPCLKGSKRARRILLLGEGGDSQGRSRSEINLEGSFPGENFAIE